MGRFRPPLPAPKQPLTVKIFPDPFAKAAALMESIVKDQPFVDGNKRTAITAAGVLLRRNRYLITTSQEGLYDFTMAVAIGALADKEVERWLRHHCSPACKPEK